MRSYKKHVQAAVGVGSAISMAYGIWIGARIKEAGILETLGVLALVCFAIAYCQKRVDRTYWPEWREDSSQNSTRSGEGGNRRAP